MTLKAACLCGKIRATAKAQPFKIGYCHCTMCRKQSGAPFTSFSIFKASDVEFSNEPTFYQSSDEAKRGFCPTCGGGFSWHGIARDRDVIAIQTGLFEKADDLIPTEHWFIGNALAWVNLDDGLPKYEGL